MQRRIHVRSRPDPGEAVSGASPEPSPPPARARRILVVTPWWPRDAEDPFGSFVRDQARALRAAGADVRVAVLRLLRPPARPAPVAPLAPGCDARGRVRRLHGTWVPYRRGYDVLVRSWTSLARRAVRGEGAWIRGALVLAHTQELAVPARRALAGSGIPFAVVAHGLEPDSPRYATAGRLREYRRALSRAARVVAVGPGLAASLRAEAPAADVRVVANGYDEDLVAAVLAGAPAAETEPRLVSVSNLVEGKGVALVVEALARRARGGRAVPLYDVVGDGPARPDLERLARSEGVGGRVRFHGALPRRAALERVRGAVAFVLPSAPEACGIAFLEALALGVPPVAVVDEGPSAFVETERSGLLVRRTVGDVADAVDRLLDEPGLSARLATGARARAGGLGWSGAARALLAALPVPRVPSPRRDRQPWLSFFHEPTPYVVGKLDDVEALCPAPIRRAWAGVDASQPWGADAPHRPEDVLDRPRPLARVALDLLRGRYAGLHVGGWSGRAATPLLLAAAWFGRRPLVIESDTHVLRSRGARAWARGAYLRWLDRRVRAWMPGGTPQAEHLSRTVRPRAPVVVEGMTSDTRTLRAEADRLGPGAGARWRRSLGIPEGARVVLYVGRLAPEKGVPDLLAAVARLVREGHDVHLVLAGPGRAPDPAPPGLPPQRVHATGRVPWRDLVPAYLAADVLALPSLFEPWGLVVNEALLLGCPVVVSDVVGAARDLVTGPGSGRAVPAGDPAALAAALADVLRSGGRDSEHARRGRAAAAAWSRERAAARVAAAMTAPGAAPNDGVPR